MDKKDRYKELTVTKDDAGRRLDRLCRVILPSLPLSKIFSALRKGDIRLNGKKVSKSAILLLNDRISIYAPLYAEGSKQKSAPSKKGVCPTGNLESAILYEDHDLLIFNKPAGLLTHGHASLDEFARKYLSDRLPHSLGFTPGPLHRLDRNTSGIVTFSKSLKGAREFSRALKDGAVTKEYICIIQGQIAGPETWRHTLVRDSHQKKTETTLNTGMSARLEVKPIGERNGCTLLLVKLETGRTHQIRVQAQANGTPLLGDTKYDGKRVLLQQKGLHKTNSNYFLHAWRLSIPNSYEIAPITIKAPVPARIRAFKDYVPPEFFTYKDFSFDFIL